MSLTVQEAFEQYLGCISVDNAAVEEAMRACREFAERLNGNRRSYVPNIEDIRFFGAACRGTAVGPLDEIGAYLIIASGPTITRVDELRAPRSFDVASLRPELSQWATGGLLDACDIARNISELAKTIQACRDVRYDEATFAVSLRYGDIGPRLRLVPVVAIRGEDGEIRQLYAPAPHVKWLLVDPIADANGIEELDNRHNGLFRPLVTSLKHWNHCCSDVRFDPAFLEALLVTLFATNAPVTELQEGVASFFREAPSRLAAGLTIQPSFARHASPPSEEQRDKLIEEHARREKIARSAIDAEERGDHSYAIREWRRIFRENFPHS